MDSSNVPVLKDEDKRKFSMRFTNFLKSRPELKTKPAILNGKRVYYFRVKRVLRFLTSEAYTPKKYKGFPEISSREEAIEVLKLLIMNSMLVRVDKLPPKQRKQKLVELQINRNQDFQDDMHYVWLYEPLPKRVMALAVLFALVVLALVLFPLWPMFMRKGAWYLSMGGLGVIGLFFVLVILRFFLFCITAVIVRPGIWLFPNLLADVGFCDSFKPLWSWHNSKSEVKKTRKSKKLSKKATSPAASATPEKSSTSTTSLKNLRHRNPTVEEVSE
ncbi:Translocation protein sec62 [Schizosaccharomyces pombe]